VWGIAPGVPHFRQAAASSVTGSAGLVTGRVGRPSPPLLADGSLYVNDFATGRLFLIPVNADGSAGALVPIETSAPLVQPDGMRTAGPRMLILAEQQGRVAELTISGNRAEVRVVMDGLARASGVTLVGNTALVLVDRMRAVVVPYRPR
jgi:hypothetical protein